MDIFENDRIPCSRKNDYLDGNRDALDRHGRLKYSTQRIVILTGLEAGVERARERRRIGRAKSHGKVQAVRGTGDAPRGHGKPSNQRILIQEMLGTRLVEATHNLG